MARCLARIVRDSDRGSFGDGSYFYHELRCSHNSLKDSDFCQYCVKRQSKVVTSWTTNMPTLPYGRITDPLPPESHIFGSHWYTEKAQKKGAPSEIEMARAKKAQLDARGIQEEKAPEVVSDTQKKRKFKVVGSQAATVPVAAPAPPAAVAVEKPKRVRKFKVALPTPVALPVSVPSKAVESREQPIQITEEDVLVIKVKKFEHNGRWYFLNSSKDKLYSIGSDGAPFQYCGRWNREKQTIDADIHDSDCEF